MYSRVLLGVAAVLILSVDCDPQVFGQFGTPLVAGFPLQQQQPGIIPGAAVIPQPNRKVFNIIQYSLPSVI